MQRMTSASNVYDAVKAVTNAKGEQIHNLAPETLELAAWLRSNDLWPR